MEKDYVANSILKSTAPLHNFSQRIGDTEVREVTDLDIVSLAVSVEAKASLDAILQQSVGLSFPIVGTIQRNGHDIALLGLQIDQCFMVSRSQQTDPVTTAANITESSAYLTDQSDSWVILELQGPSATRALERICPIDLSNTVFGERTVARTAMEHISVIIERPAVDTYRLYSPRSSANSFLHAVTVSLENVTKN